MRPSEPIPVAVDDGRQVTRIAWLEGERIRTAARPALARSGQHGLPVGASGEPIGTVLQTEGETYTVARTGRADSTQFAGYPYSALNRVILHHDLIALGLEPGRIERLAVMLAFEDYFTDTEARIAARARSVTKPVSSATQTRSLIAPGSVRVYPASVMAWADGRIDDSGQDCPTDAERIGLVDIGARATRVVVVDAATGVVSHDRSTVLPVGVMSAAQRLKREIEASFDHHLHLPAHEALACLQDPGPLILFGARFDVRALVSDALDGLADQIQAESLASFPADEAVFIGGGAALVGDRLSSGRIARDPAFASVRGALKYLLHTP